jgi:hypothetical protein
VRVFFSFNGKNMKESSRGKKKLKKWVDIKKGGVSLPKVMDLLGWMSSCQPAPTGVVQQQLTAAIR